MKKRAVTSTSTNNEEVKKKEEKAIEESTPTPSPAVKVDFKRIAFRCIIIIGVILFMSYSQKTEFDTFASHKDEIKLRKEDLNCSPDYYKDIKPFKGCIPKKCGRMVSDHIISLSEVQALLIIAEKGLSLGGSAGGASILDLHSGALSHGDSFINIYKIDKGNKKINNEDLKIYIHIKNKIKNAIAQNFGLEKDKLFLTHPTFFSRITPQEALTVHDEYWHPHVDKETYESFHYTSLLYLTEYNRHFKGGRFVFIDQRANKTVEPREGRLSAFTSGAENLHYVEKVTEGTRFAITVSFTCDPKHAIDDPTIKNKS